MIPRSKLPFLVSWLLLLSACGTLLDDPTGSLQLAQTPPYNFCTAGTQAAGHAGTANPGGGAGSGVAGTGGSAGNGNAGNSAAGTSSAGSGGGGGAGGLGGAGGQGGGESGAGGTAGNGGDGGTGGAGGQGGQGGQSGDGGAAGVGGSASAGSSGSGNGGEAGAGGGNGGSGQGTSPYEIITSTGFSTFETTPLPALAGGLALLQTGEETFRIFSSDEAQQGQEASFAFGTWSSGWSPLPISGIGPALAATSDDFGVWHLLVQQGQQIADVQRKNKVWSLPQIVGDAGVTSGAAAARGNGGAISVFARGASGGLLATIVKGTASVAWSDLGGALAPNTAPAAVLDAVGNLHLVALWSDGTLRYRRITETNPGDWESWGGNFTSAPAVASWGPGRLDVFARDIGGTLFYRALREDNVLAPSWTDLQEPTVGAPAAIAPGLGQLRVLIKTPQNEVKSAELLP